MLMESMQSGKIQVGVIHHIKGSRFGHQLIMATIIPAPLDEVFVFFSREETDKGTLMTDTVRYRLPLGVLGKVAHRLFVRRDVEEIFRYRQKIIKEIFFADG